MEAWDNLAHQIALLAIKPEGGRVRRRSDLALATAGGALAELALQERVSLVNRKVQVHDSRPTEDPLLDIMLRVLADKGARRPSRILDSAKKAYLNQALSELITNGWVVMTPGTGLGPDRYDVVDPERLARIRETASSGLRDPEGVPARTACVAGLAAQMGLTAELVPELNWRQRMSAKAKLARRDGVVKAMRDVIAARAAAAS